MLHSPLINTLKSFIIGGVGALIGYWLHFPVFILTGPAILVTLLSLAGVRFEIMPIFRDAAFVIIGISIGTGVTPQATAAFARWPLAFAVLGVALLAILLISPPILSRLFGFERNAAVLASTPGHLSYVMSLSAEMNANILQISVVQSVRMFFLTMLVPFAALAFGLELGGVQAMAAQPMPLAHVGMLIPLALVVGLVLKRLGVPAALLIGAMIISAIAHASEVTQGALSPAIALSGLLVIGTMIGTRFSGVTIARLRDGFLAGIVTTFVAMSAALLASWSVAAWLDMPLVHVLVAFAPGGLETMVAMGVVLGANPGFVAAAHVSRLLMLVVLLPLVLRFSGPAKAPQ